MKITEQITEQENTYMLEGRFDAHQAPKLQSKIEPINNNVTLDFSGVGFIDSTGIALLVRFYKYSKENTLNFRIINVQDQVRLIFEIAQLHTVLPIEQE